MGYLLQVYVLRARVLRASFAEGLQGGVSMKALRALCLDLSRCAHRALSFQAGYVYWMWLTGAPSRASSSRGLVLQMPPTVTSRPTYHSF